MFESDIATLGACGFTFCCTCVSVPVIPLELVVTFSALNFCEHFVSCVINFDFNKVLFDFPISVSLHDPPESYQRYPRYLK